MVQVMATESRGHVRELFLLGDKMDRMRGSIRYWWRGSMGFLAGPPVSGLGIRVSRVVFPRVGRPGGRAGVGGNMLPDVTALGWAAAWAELGRTVGLSAGSPSLSAAPPPRPHPI